MNEELSIFFTSLNTKEKAVLKELLKVGITTKAQLIEKQHELLDKASNRIMKQTIQLFVQEINNSINNENTQDTNENIFVAIPNNIENNLILHEEILKEIKAGNIHNKYLIPDRIERRFKGYDLVQIYRLPENEASDKGCRGNELDNLRVFKNEFINKIDSYVDYYNNYIAISIIPKEYGQNTTLDQQIYNCISEISDLLVKRKEKHSPSILKMYQGIQQPIFDRTAISYVN